MMASLIVIIIHDLNCHFLPVGAALRVDMFENSRVLATHRFHPVTQSAGPLVAQDRQIKNST